MATIRCVARFIAKPDKAAAMEAIFQSLLGPTRKEEGCISYQLLKNTGDPTDFVFVEEWASNAALDAHMTTPHVAAALPKLGDMVAAAPDIRRYTVIG